MNKYFLILCTALVCLVSCNETSNEYNPYEDWQSRNAAWFEDTVQVARAAISQAKAEYGDNWEEHCQWCIFKSLNKTTTSTGPITDSICVRIMTHGLDPEGKGSPAANDSAHISYRGWLMPTYNYTGNGSEMGWNQEMFDSSYLGEYNPETSAPALMSIGNLLEGFSTAIQYMVEGDEWMVFIPQNLAYGSKNSKKIRGYSSLQFHIHLVRWYESGTGSASKWE